MEALRELQGTLVCELCNQVYDKPYSFGTCGHTFCYGCVIPTLEGPGITKSECPKCHQPGWRNDLVYNHTVFNAVELTQGLLVEVQQRRARQGARAQRHASSQRNALQLRPQPAHQAAVVAAAPRRAGGGGQVPSRSRSGSAKRRRRGRPAPEEQSEEEEEEEEETGGQALRQARPQWQHPHQHPHQQDASRQYMGAALDKVEAVQSNRKGSDAVLPADGVAEGLDPETPPAVIYDTDWEERMLARSPPGPEELAELEAEVKLLELALRMCDLLPCKGGQAASAPPAADCGGGCSGGGNGTQLLSSLEAGPSLQLPAGHQRCQAAPDDQQALPAATSVPPSPEEAKPAGTAGTAAGTADVTVARQPQLEQATALQQRSRAQQGAIDMCLTQQAKQQGGERHEQQQQQRRQGRGKGRKAALSVQLASNDDEEGDDEGPRLSGRKRRKASSSRGAGANPSRLAKSQQPTASDQSHSAAHGLLGGKQRSAPAAALAASGGGGAGSARRVPAAASGDSGSDRDGAVKSPAKQRHQRAEHRLPLQQQEQQQQQQDQQQQQQAYDAGQESQPAVCVGDAVEVLWRHEGRLAPFCGRVVAVTGSQHEVEYLDGEVAPHRLQEEQWRLLQHSEFQQALQHWQRESNSPSSGGGWQGSPPLTASRSQEGGSAAAQAAPPAVVQAPPADVQAAAAAAAAATSRGADPYQFVSSTEAQVQADSALPGRLLQQLGHPAQQQQQAQQQAAQQQPGSVAAAAATAQQQGSTKGTGAAALGSTGMLAGRPPIGPYSAAGAAGPDAAAPLLQQQGWQDKRGAGRLEFVPSTQDAASTLFEMLGGQPPQPAAQRSGGFVPASQLAAAELPPQQQQPQQQALQRVQHPAGDSGGGQGLGAAAEPLAGAAGASEQQQVQQQAQQQALQQDGGSARRMRALDLFQGIDSPQESQVPYSSPPAAATFNPSAPLGPDACPDSNGGDEAPPYAGRRRLLVFSSNSVELQEEALRLQALLGGMDLEEQVTERTSHVLVKVDDHGRILNRSIQYLLALAHGCWIVSHAYVSACLSAGCWLPERLYQALGSEDSPQAPMLSRQRHIGGAGLLTGRRIWLVAGKGMVGAPEKLAAAQQMVTAEGGILVRGPAQWEGGGRRGRGTATPSPPLEGATLLVCLAATTESALGALKQVQKRYHGRPLIHQNWLYGSLCHGRILEPSSFYITERCPLPTYNGVAGSWASQTQGTQA